MRLVARRAGLLGNEGACSRRARGQRRGGETTSRTSALREHRVVGAPWRRDVVRRWCAVSRVVARPWRGWRGAWHSAEAGTTRHGEEAAALGEQEGEWRGGCAQDGVSGEVEERSGGRTFYTLTLGLRSGCLDVRAIGWGGQGTWMRIPGAGYGRRGGARVCRSWRRWRLPWSALGLAGRARRAGPGGPRARPRGPCGWDAPSVGR